MPGGSAFSRGNAGNIRKLCAANECDAMLSAMTHDLSSTSKRPTPSHPTDMGGGSSTTPGYPDRGAFGGCDAPMLTVAEVAGFLCVSEKTVKRMIKKGALNPFRFGRVVRISREDLRRCITAFQK
jgi:excisionase family DNA binding protein